MSFSRFATFLAVCQSVCATFTPCPILGPNFPQPTSITNSQVIKNGTDKLNAYFDQATRTGQLADNTFTTNTTTFSIALFSADNSSAQDPFFWQYHYTAPSLKNAAGTRAVGADSVYRLGSLTQVFNVWALLVNKGEQCLDRPVTDFVPELAQAASVCSAGSDPLACVDWHQITLRDMGSHLSGIGRDYGFGDLAGQTSFVLERNSSEAVTCGVDKACNRAEFLAGIARRGPVYAPGTTPIFSDAAFQILGYALENITGRSFPNVLKESIISQIGTQSLGFEAPTDMSSAVWPESPSWSAELGDGASTLGLYSNIRDLAAAGQAMLSSRFLTPAQTRRWLKPVTLTSNIANSVGMPWEIYAGTSNANTSVTEILTYPGTLGPYSSYIGLVPNYNVGFAVLAVDTTGSAPDLNAHVDLIDTALSPALEELAIRQALTNHAGTYVDASSGAKLTIDATYTPTALNVLSFSGRNGTDLKTQIANLTGIAGGAEDLSFRLFPTNLATDKARAFRAIWQDINAPEDAGTATCVTWQYVDQLINNGKALDSFVFSYENGTAVGLEAPGFGLKLVRKRS